MDNICPGLPVPEIPEVSDDELKLFQVKLLKERGFDLTQYTSSFVKRRVSARMMACGVKSFAGYIACLNKSPEEYISFLDAFTINVTEFFRDPSVWNLSKQEVLPAIIRGKKERQENTICLWSAGCASGEEAYTMAMLVKEVLGKELANYLVTITATDIDSDSLKKAEEAVYAPSALKNIPEPLLKKYFSEVGDKFRVNDEIKKMVMFKKHHFFQDTPLLRLDLILCRNVIIYFNPPMKEKLLEIFHNSLNPHGFLIIGKTETIFGRVGLLFHSYNLKEHIFRKERRSTVSPAQTETERRKEFWWGEAQNLGMFDKKEKGGGEK